MLRRSATGRLSPPPRVTLRNRFPRIFGTITDFLGNSLGTTRVSFESFTLDAATRQLLRGPAREPVHLSPKAYDLLWVLVDARPRALSKGELHERLWPSTFVSDAALASLVSELRDALDDQGRQARFIRTVHGFGYAFSASAHEDAVRASNRAVHWVVYAGREIPLCDGEHVLGRDGAASIALRSSTVSRHHARIIVAGVAATLEDLGSKNGTLLSGRKVTSPTGLSDGDRIRVGDCELTFRTLAAPGSTETAL